MKRCISVFGAAAVLVSVAAAQDWPRYETSLEYTFTRFSPATNASSINANGGSAQFAYNFNRWFSGVIDLGAVHNGRVLDSTMANYLAGPRISFNKGSRITPYFQVLVGGVYATSSTQASITAIGLDAGVLPAGTTIRATRQETAFGMTAGGGLDIKMSKHVSFRPIQVEYFLTRLENLRAFNDNSQNNLRYSAGLNFTFGGEEPTPPPPPPTHPQKTCPDGSTVPADAACPKQNLKLSLSASPQELCQGESAPVNASIAGGDSNQLNFQWSVNGQLIGQGHTFVFGTVGREPGNYTVALTVGGANFNPASAQTTFTVREYRAPTGTAQANPAEIYFGDKSTLSASCQGQCGGNIQMPTFSASEGSVQGDQFDSSAVQFDSSNKAEQRKTVTITATCTDNRSSGTATTSITVIKKAVITPIRLPDVLFDVNSARVNNCGKRILLEQLRSYFERDSAGKVVLVGHQSSDEKPANLAEQRVLNAAAVITAGTGVCLAIPQNQVLVSSPGVDQNGVPFEPGFCSSSVRGGTTGTAEMRRVEVWFVPNGGQLPTSSATYQDASYLPVSTLGCPR
jgi:opacity protein-like surface antigen/outer membrane protein OmpA-like peptidoglycan-associated protein